MSQPPSTTTTTTTATATTRRVLRRSRFVSTFAHMGEVYLYHDLYGYILKMSPDILDFLACFASPVSAESVCGEFTDAFAGETPESFVEVFYQFGCLVEPGEDEVDGIWDRVPVKGRWNVWVRGDDGTITIYAAWGDRPLSRHRLDVADTAIWDDFDGQVRLIKLAEKHGAERVAALVQRLVHHEVQALKLSHAPMAAYKGRADLQPPYLTSTMPYAPYDPAKDPVPAPFTGVFSPASYYQHEVIDADAQFDHQETTLSHLLRVPHPALGDRTYGAALVHALAERGVLPPDRIRVLEIGGGLGFVAAAVVEALTARDLAVTYDILELAPALAAAQRERTAGLPVTVHEGDALTAPWPPGGHDLILANEMIGDLPAARITHAELGLGGEGEIDDEDWKARLEKLGAAGQAIARYQIPVGDAPDPFYINLGAIQLLERVWKGLAPGGAAVITEFGEMSRWPILSTQLDHPELSIHFGHLALVARELGFETDFAFVIDLIDIHRAHEGLATTRSHFRALKALLADHGVTLEKIGYTRAMFEQLLAGKVDMGKIGDLRFDRIEDRLMGLVPHEFKALVLKRPVAM